MPRRENISMSVIKRLPRYYRFLAELNEKGVTRISSRELSQRMAITASQIRQDLNCFGGFGQQGYGYNVPQLYEEIGHILGVNSSLKTIILGAGNLGRAIATHMQFESRGLKLIGIFDIKEAMCGRLVRGMPVRHIDGLDEFCKEQLPVIAVLCIPKEAAGEAVDTLIKLGIQGFWNFSHYDFAAKYPDVPVENVHLTDSLMTLCYRVNDSLSANDKTESI